jgi:hypothetical protein
LPYLIAVSARGLVFDTPEEIDDPNTQGLCHQVQAAERDIDPAILNGAYLRAMQAKFLALLLLGAALFWRARACSLGSDSVIRRLRSPCMRRRPRQWLLMYRQASDTDTCGWAATGTQPDRAGHGGQGIGRVRLMPARTGLHPATMAAAITAVLAALMTSLAAA